MGFAEALHVDGYYRKAVQLWGELVNESAGNDAVLRLAVTCAAMGNDYEALDMLTALERDPVMMEPVLYTRAQIAWRNRDPATSLTLFQKAIAANPKSPMAYNSAAQLCRIVGLQDESNELMSKALALNDPHALINRFIANSESPSARDGLLQALLQMPHRPEGHIAMARHFGQIGCVAKARQAKKRAHLRVEVMPEPELVISVLEVLTMSVSGTIDSQGLSLKVEIEPKESTIHQGHWTFEINRNLTVACESGIVIRESATGHLDRIKLRVRQGALCLCVSGRPEGPCASLTGRRIELAGPSGWLPVFRKKAVQFVSFEVSLPSGWKMLQEISYHLSNNPILIAFNRPKIRYVAERKILIQNQEGNSKNLYSSEISALCVARGLEYWQEICACKVDPNIPSIAVVDLPKSTFCYAGRDIIRLPSKVVKSSDLHSIIFHEAGHVFWNQVIRFETDAAWWREGLAEYTLHLAQDTGDLDGYRSQVLSLIADCRDLASRSLNELATLENAEARAIYRIKAGFVVAMLAQVMGQAHFEEFVTALAAGCKRGDRYQIEALASWCAGDSLRWFFRQWVDNPALISFENAELEFSPQPSETQAKLTVALANWTTPGVAVSVLVECVDGSYHIVEENLEAGVASQVIDLPSHPVRALIDPDNRLFAIKGKIQLVERKIA
ncbi:MAG: hypothetical protein AAF483_10010 [Planctomycetota bacterium]